MVPLYLLAIAGCWFVPRRFLVLVLVLRRLRDVRGVGLRRDDALPRRLGLRARACSPRRRSRECRSARSARGCRCGGRRARSGRPPRSARCSGPRGSARSRGGAPRGPSRPPGAGSSASREHRLGERVGVARRDEQARLAVAHEVLEPADRGGDHRAARAPSPRARPCRSPRRATARRRRATRSIAALDRRHVAEEAHRLVRGRARARGPSARARARRARRCRAARRAARRAPSGTRAAARRGP